MQHDPYEPETQMTFPGDLEDWFAGQALMGICAAHPSFDWTNARISQDAYGLAAAMMAERAKRGKK